MSIHRPLHAIESLPVLAGVFVLCCLLAAPQIQAETVVFGSYSSEVYAAENATRTATALGIETRVVAADVNGTTYLRILGPAGLSNQEARALLARARSSGFESAWILPETAATAPPRLTTPETARAPSPAQAGGPIFGQFGAEAAAQHRSLSP